MVVMVHLTSLAVTSTTILFSYNNSLVLSNAEAEFIHIKERKLVNQLLVFYGKLSAKECRAWFCFDERVRIFNYVLYSNI